MKVQPLRLTLREATSTAILDAAERVAAKGGLAGASLQAIAEEAGIAVGTIYNYFADKTRLFDALFDRRREELYVNVDLAMKPRAKDPFEGQLRALVGAVFTHFDARRDFLRVALEADRPQLVKGQDGKKSPAMQQLQDRIVLVPFADWPQHAGQPVARRPEPAEPVDPRREIAMPGDPRGGSGS